MKIEVDLSPQDVLTLTEIQSVTGFDSDDKAIAEALRSYHVAVLARRRIENPDLSRSEVEHLKVCPTCKGWTDGDCETCEGRLAVPMEESA